MAALHLAVVDGVVLETFDLQGDLHRLLTWAHDMGVELRDLEAGPVRLDDVFRALDGPGSTTPATTPVTTPSTSPATAPTR